MTDRSHPKPADESDPKPGLSRRQVIGLGITAPLTPAVALRATELEGNFDTLEYIRRLLHTTASITRSDAHNTFWDIQSATSTDETG
jgi:hypothetical protein